jgi:hypothetical protein
MVRATVPETSLWGPHDIFVAHSFMFRTLPVLNCIMLTGRTGSIQHKGERPEPVLSAVCLKSRAGKIIHAYFSE